jgi:hypothetical protein
MMTRIIRLAAILLLLTGSFSCQKDNEHLAEEPDETEVIPDVKLPATDLVWLKKMMTDRVKEGTGFLTYIHQCTYKDGLEGFVVWPCVNCTINYQHLYSLEGELLASSPPNLPEWNIQNMKVFWKYPEKFPPD